MTHLIFIEHIHTLIVVHENERAIGTTKAHHAWSLGVPTARGHFSRRRHSRPSPSPSPCPSPFTGNTASTRKESEHAQKGEKPQMKRIWHKHGIDRSTRPALYMYYVLSRVIIGRRQSVSKLHTQQPAVNICTGCVRRNTSKEQ